MTPVRKLTPDDADAYVALRREMLADSPWAFGASPGHDRGSDPAQVRTSLAGVENALLAVVESDRLLAAAGVLREERPKRRHIALIWGVYVTPSARGRGLGRAVVAAAVEMARVWPGIAAIQLTVSEGAPAARRLYESLGFTAWGTEPGAIQVDGRLYAETHMRLVV